MTQSPVDVSRSPLFPTGKAMSSPRRLLLTFALASVAALPFSAAMAQSGVVLGQRMSPQQVKSLGNLPTVQINGKSYQVAQTRTGSEGQPVSLLIDPHGRVGRSFHEVVIAEQPTAGVQQRAGAVLAQAVAVTAYEHLNVTVARFATLAQAAAALEPLRTVLPGAQVGLPIRTSEPLPH